VSVLTGFAVLFAALVLLVPSAGAVLLHPFESSFDASDSPAGSFQPDKVGIDQSSGDVYVIDKANNVLAKFDSSGNYLSQSTVDNWGAAPDIAVDNSATASQGNVAIAPEGGPVTVVDPSGGELFQIPATGNDTPDGQFDDNCGLAIGPADGDIYVAEFGQQAIDRFDSTGAFVSQVTVGFSPCDLAVDTDGTIYAVELNSSLHKLDSTGTDLGVVDTTDGGSGAVNIDPSDSHVYFDRGNTFAEWDAGAQNLLTVSGTGVLSGSAGIDVNGTSGKVYASTGATVAIFGANAIVPTVTTDAASNVTFNSATLNGTVNPDGVQVTDCHFDYGTSTAYELGSVPCLETPATIGSGSSDVPVHADVSGLGPETDYHFHLVAANANGSNNGQDAVFTTTPVVGVTTDPASNITETSATLNGSVNPLGAQVTDCHFDYTDDADFQGNGFANATSTPCVEDPGSGNSPVPVHADISGLTAGTTYDYRVVATTANGTKEAFPLSFTTVATPTLTTQATDAAFGGIISDQATLSGGVNPTGTITFTAYGPGDDTCAGPPAYTSDPVDVSGNGSYGNSPAFTPATAGTYRWQATYTGDAGNDGVSTSCNDANETSVVAQATPTITSKATTSATIGSPIGDQASIAGGSSPTGTITFTAYGPNDANCAHAPAYTSSALTVDGSRNFSNSPDFTPAAAGTYRWRVSYSGDVNNAAVITPCDLNTSSEVSTVTKAKPTITTQATANVALGQSIADQATLSGGHSPTGTITFTAYGPNDTDCSHTPVYASSAQTVSGNGDYGNSPAFTPATAGTYRWRAFYLGDANNLGVSTPCNEANEASVVAQTTPTLVTTATGSVTLGQALFDQATLSSGDSPTGTITFTAYGPNDPNCANAPAYTSSAVTVDGNGDYDSSPPFTPSTAGTFRWTASYSGDANNAAVSTPCNEANEASVVNAAVVPPPVITPVPPATGQLTKKKCKKHKKRAAAAKKCKKKKKKKGK
jgi:hypothetical protein